MIDHVGIHVADVEASKAFYRAALAPLGYSELFDLGSAGAGFGAGGKPDFWVHPGAGSSGVHLAFQTPDRDTVDRFHAAALAAGATDNGGPGLRAQYHPDYYGAFVLDPDGNNIEAVCHLPP